MTKHVLCLLLSAPLLVGCDEDPSGASGDPVDCDAEVTEVDVTVARTSGNVVFDWTPRCRVALLLVEAEGGDLWAIGEEDANLIEPPVTYGLAPAGLTIYGPEELVPGTEYELVLWTTSPEADRLVAVHPFTR